MARACFCRMGIRGQFGWRWGGRIGISNHQCEPSLPITDSHNRPYVEPKLRGRVPCLDYSGRQ